VTPRQIIEKWLAAFNEANTKELETLYANNAVNHQMPNEPVTGRQAIGQMFRDEFVAAPDMHCIPVQIIEEGNWAVLEWRDPKGFRGCGFFEVRDELIQTQRGYWDKLTFNKLYSVETGDIK
jgi:limonene-1,2-epoxide hydrolase